MVVWGVGIGDNENSSIVFIIVKGENERMLGVSVNRDGPATDKVVLVSVTVLRN